MNSFAAVERAIDVECARQVARLEGGERVVSETLLWDAGSSSVRPQRSKEESHDYRYFPEPDLPPLVLTAGWIAARREELPELPAARRERMMAQWGIAAPDAAVLSATAELADYFEALAAAHGDGKTAATWVMGDVLAWLNDRKQVLAGFPLVPHTLAGLLDIVRDGVVSRTAARQVFFAMLDEGGTRAAADVADALGLRQVRDDGALQGWVDEVLAAHPGEVQRLRDGEQKLLGVLVGQVMKRSGGRADPRRVNELLRERTRA
jgi:aspartyl-tRNA(Asn)/glutamyl-tRNA(Gln) amidotransferase subunit B